jgi:phenylglyoxylate dehydrogenase epsilon subunit
MSACKYLIVGGSHAGLSAIDAIRLLDSTGSMTLITGEDTFPYSPTILPYMISGQADPDQVFLRDKRAMDQLNLNFMKGIALTDVNCAAHSVKMSSGETIEYEKLLLATGATPALPSIPGLAEVPYHVLRTLDDALHLKNAMDGKHSAIVIGAGLIGMHAAENLVKTGMEVRIVEALPQVLPDYFDEEAAGLIQQVFEDEGVKVLTGSNVNQVSKSHGRLIATLNSEEKISADLILISTGVKPCIDYLPGSEIKVDQGVLVDDRMRTSVDGIWAAGDLAQAHGFFDSKKQLTPTLPDAVEQGRIAGMDMVGDPTVKSYKGGIPMNTFKYFGHRAFSVGLVKGTPLANGIEVDQASLPASQRYQKLLFQNDQLMGVLSINTKLDPGIMYELIKRRIDLKDVRARFVDHPQETGRILMTKIWR